MAQMLAYLFAVQETRVKRKSLSKKSSTAIFGALTDFADFRFVMLRETGKAMQSELLSWAMRSDQVVWWHPFVDSIRTVLLDVIKWSPHTTPQILVNSTIKHFDDDHLKMANDITGEESAAVGGEDDDVSLKFMEFRSDKYPTRPNRGDDLRSSSKRVRIYLCNIIK
ncbi:hypothetical protein ACJ73_06194 [Blastomyces percursus]|uniref:Uncharacterized protein n=1 Tax=Blastomyces percursus TaxID=1658174 RepID=A0A1J9Q1K8_9EURO|nr:hypothetical protein ACJ73_06194 [Blastomyces percursus]